MTLWHGFLAALQFLTRLPVAVPDSSNPQPSDTGLVWFPVVGVVLGAILLATDVLFRGVLGVLLASALEVVLLLLLTGGLHADGLIDTADGVFPHAPRDRRLEIMRDPRAGSFGVLAAVSLLLVKFAALATLAGAVRLTALVLVPVVGRAGIVLAARVFPSGRPAGLGAAVKNQASARTMTLVAVFALLLVGVSSQLAGLAVLFLVAAAVLLLGRWLTGVLAGLTGDCYGAICEVAETLFLILTVVVMQPGQVG